VYASITVFAAGVGSRLRSWLATHPDELTGPYRIERAAHVWHERSQFLHTIRLRQDDDDADTRGLQVLLKRQVLIDREQGLKPWVSMSFRSSPFRLDDQPKSTTWWAS
jgi:hypothetical protein